MNQTNYYIETKITYTHLTLAERCIIEKDYRDGLSLSKIATKLGRSKSTIHYEITHNGKLKQYIHSGMGRPYMYYAKAAHNKARDNKRVNLISESHLILMKEFKAFAKEHPTYSIEQLYYLIKASSKPTLRTFYDWLYYGLIGCLQYKRRRNKKSGLFNDSEGRKNIKKRAIGFGFEQDEYTKTGHYEIDTIIDGLKNGGLITFSHRATMRLYARYVTDKKATTVNKAIRSIINEIGAHNILSITSDNGTEFAYSAVIEKSYDLQWYYCDPYRSGQRGQNERLNRDLRTFFPKGTVFKRVPEKRLKHALSEINNMPRRKYDGASSIEYSQLLTSQKKLAS